MCRFRAAAAATATPGVVMDPKPRRKQQVQGGTEGRICTILLVMSASVIYHSQYSRTFQPTIPGQGEPR